MTSVHDMGLLRAAVPFIRAYKNKIFVVKIGGELCHPGPVLDNVMEQLGLLYQLGMKIVLVHGGGPQATELGDKLGVESSFVNGRRITSSEFIDVAKMAFAGTINTDVIAAGKRAGLPTVGLSGIDGDLLTAVRRETVEVVDAETRETRRVDFGFVGDVKHVDPRVIQHLLAGDFLPVICSLAADANGQVLNINADSLASALAIRMEATKFCLLTNVDGVMGNLADSSTLLSYIDVVQAEELLASSKITGGMVAKLRTCVEAVKGGVPRAHIVNGRVRDSLLKEILTNEGSGTLIVRTKLKEELTAPAF